MKMVEASEFQAHFSALLEQVERGEEITITRHSKAIARLVPAVAAGRGRLADTVARLKTFPRGCRLRGGLTCKALIEEGRR